MEPIDIDWINIDTLTHISPKKGNLFTKEEDAGALITACTKPQVPFILHRKTVDRNKRNVSHKEATCKAQCGRWMTPSYCTQSHSDNSTSSACAPTHRALHQWKPAHTQISTKPLVYGWVKRLLIIHSTCAVGCFRGQVSLCKNTRTGSRSLWWRSRLGGECAFVAVSEKAFWKVL